MKQETQFNKALILPIVAFVVFNLKLIFNIELPSDYVDMTTDAILSIFSLIGFFMQPNK